MPSRWASQSLLEPSCEACGHHFHRGCLEKALVSGKGCPLCRRPLRRPEGGLTALRVYSAEMERSDFPAALMAFSPLFA